MGIRILNILCRRVMKRRGLEWCRYSESNSFLFLMIFFVYFSFCTSYLP